MIKRDLYQNLKEHILKKEITFIVGPRHFGTTHYKYTGDTTLGFKERMTQGFF
ncbi:hypothetical protein ES708_09879 [subsurface metagenome]